jgi:hypothetical protein
VQPVALEELVAVAAGEVLVDRPAAAGPLVVVVDHQPTAGDQVRLDPLQAGHRRLVPVAVEVGERDRLVQVDRVLEQAADQLDVVLVDRYSKAGERLGDLAVEVVAVAVVGLAADARRRAAMSMGPPFPPQEPARAESGEAHIRGLDGWAMPETA